MKTLKTTLARSVLCLAIFGLPLTTQAAFINFTATLTSGDEFPTPPVASDASGSLTAIFDTDTHVLTWTLVAKDLTAPTTAVHFHGNTPLPPNHTGLARAVVLGFVGAGIDPDVTSVLNTLDGATSGMYIGVADLDLALNDRAGDQPLTVAEQIQGLLNTEWYVNIHNANNPAGEIRGQVFLASPVAAIPVPAVAWLVGAAFAVLPYSRRQRQR